MVNLSSFMESGILECYVLGNSTPQEIELVEQMAASYTEVEDEIVAIAEALHQYAQANAVAPDPLVKPFVLATVDYTERLKGGEAPTFPPILNPSSTIADFAPWLNRADLVAPAVLLDIYAKIIGYTPEASTAIVWIKDRAPEEVHTTEHEKFLIITGTCNITVEEDVYSLVAGDYFEIPLFKKHQVIVTSSIACKVILQRLAA